MDVLSRFISRAVSSDRLSGFKVGEGSQEVTVSHLLFADDTLILCKADPEEMACLREILLCFQTASNLKINLVKSDIIQVGNGIDKRSLVEKLGCKSGSLPTTYLGLPLGSHFKSKVVWGSVMDRLEKRLASWKWQYLSKGGKLTLIQSSLSSMPTYYLSLVTIPKPIASRLERFAQGEDKLWCRVLEGKYGTLSGEWRTKDISNSHGTGLRKGIMKVWGDFYPLVTHQLGNGSKISFWHDVWLLQEARPNSQEIDKWRWMRQAKGSFTVSSFYQSLTGLGDPDFPWKGIWVSSVPSKVCFFGWATAKGAILTIDNLRKRRLIVTEWCFMCKRNAKTTDHLLIHCVAANELWNLVLSIFGIQWVMPRSVRDLFACWSQKSVRGHRRRAWRAALLCLFWSIWRERNLRAFEDIENSLIFLKTSFLASFFMCSRRDFPSSPSRMVDILGELHPSDRM
ncbi:hypothetical protein Acr_00g0045080 [Actinidia rufa]|uniref:Reverse transcriptase zinc-binding domain-containing protein n=1 Tax=Actinidia rufa TaxID=165716 RepID=A0A7J0DJI0_9ERIC|nr:hypothetical protein Acr_00g0045080 [Actinidia rufa]